MAAAATLGRRAQADSRRRFNIHIHIHIHSKLHSAPLGFGQRNLGLCLAHRRRHRHRHRHRHSLRHRLGRLCFGRSAAGPSPAKAAGPAVGVYIVRVVELCSYLRLRRLESRAHDASTCCCCCCSACRRMENSHDGDSKEQPIGMAALVQWKWKKRARTKKTDRQADTE